LGACFFDGLVAVVEDGQAVFALGAAFSGHDSADHFGAVFEALGGVECAGPSGDALADYFGVGVNEDAHGALVSFVGVEKGRG
jgi:hypothetical protein